MQEQVSLSKSGAAGVQLLAVIEHLHKQVAESKVGNATGQSD
jgi:hypothetical protein